MVKFSDLAKEVFQALKVFSSDMVLYGEDSMRVYDPEEATKFFLSDSGIMLTLVDEDPVGTVEVYLSDDMGMDKVLNFTKVMKSIAISYGLLFHIKKINKKIEPKDFASKSSVVENTEYGEQSMKLFEGMYGTSKSSYLKLESARMIIRHSARINPTAIGSRGRSVDTIFVENADGERFKFPVNSVYGARAMTQHVNYGGTFADEVGQQIIRIASDFMNLNKAMTLTRGNPDPIVVGIRESIKDATRAHKNLFSRMSLGSDSYKRAIGIMAESVSLLEGDVSSKVDELAKKLGGGFDQSILETIARHCEFDNALTEDTESDLDDGDDLIQSDSIVEFEKWCEESDPEIVLTQPSVGKYRTMGRVFNTVYFMTDDDANEYMETNPGWGLIGIKDGERHLARMDDEGSEVRSSSVFDVYLNGECIDTVFFGPGTSPEEVKTALVDHDGMDPAIVVIPSEK